MNTRNEQEIHYATESRVRHLRALCYGDIHDPEWEKVKHTWMQPQNVKWLEEHSRIRPFCAEKVYWKEWK